MSWEASYRAGHTPWQRLDVNPGFHHWFDGADLAGKQVLIPGCGTSIEPVLFASRGAVVTCIDLASFAIAKQKEAFIDKGYTGNFICADALLWRSDTRFDIVYEQTFLCAVRWSEREEYERAVWEALRHGGVLYALFMQTGNKGGPPFHCELSDMRAIFGPARWDWSEHEPYRSDHPLGVIELGAALQKRAE